MYYLIAYRCQLKVKDEMSKYIDIFKNIDTEKNGFITRE